ncbi:MAG TPA: cyclic nucleotide-binding domain-containing protein [Thermodesulfobacteriota bacterium]|nr:cyclic nucleotide-binding domain-containing protein [Thermodesulfobacteriota bacterium]
MRLTSNMETQKVKTIDLESLKQKLNSMSLFSQLSSDDLKGLVEKSSLRQFEAGSVICREGEYGDTAFAILGGTAEVSINTAGYKNLTLALLGEGNIFGEMAALSGYPRSATVSAKEALYLLEIPAEVLKNLMKHSPGFKDAIEGMYAERAVKTYLRKVPLFSALDDSVIEKLEKDVNLKSYKSGDIIFNEGDQGDSLFVIRTGFVKITKKHLDKEQIIAYLSQGNYFGEMALLEDERRTATVSAFTNVEVLQVLKEDFNMLLDADSKLAEGIRDIIIERKLRTLKVQKDPSKSERLQALVEKGIIQAESLLIIDLKTCIHCNNCVDACEDRHGYPRLDRRGTRVADVSIPVACRLCHDPVCLICNFDAIKRAPTGEIYIIDDKCVGCAGCAIRCPYNVIQMVPSKPEHELKKFNIISALLKGVKEDDNKTPKDHKIKPKHLAIKCDNCMGYHDTACTNNCPTNAIRWVNPIKYFLDTEDLIPKREKYQ